MKKGIHPTYYADAKIVCACGTVYDVGSTKENQKIEICSKCHPFYTGQRRIVDTGGRVERFIKKYNWGAEPEAGQKKGPKVKKGAEEVQEILEELEAAEATAGVQETKEAAKDSATKKKAAAKKAPAEKAPAEKAPAKKAPAEKAPAKKAPGEKAPAKKAPAKKAAANEA